MEAVERTVVSAVDVHDRPRSRWGRRLATFGHVAAPGHQHLADVVGREAAVCAVDAVPGTSRSDGTGAGGVIVFMWLDGPTSSTLPVRTGDRNG